MRRALFGSLMPVVASFWLFLALGLFSKPALAANPTTINFQGKVVNANGTNVSDGSYSFVFRIYNTATPTPASTCSSDVTCLYEETQASISVTSGTFQVQLGSTCAGGLVASNACTKSVAGGLNFNGNNALYLTLQFNGDTSGTHGGFMWPLIQLTSVPYAFYADNAGALGGLSSGNFVQLAQSLQTDSSSNESIAIKKTGTANILDLQNSTSTLLVFANTGALTISPSGNNVGTIFKQTSGTATSGDIFDVQTSGGASDFIQITNAATNEGNVTVQSVGATRNLTLNSSNGTLVFGSNTTTAQKSGAAFALDVTNGSSNSELDITNSGGTGNITLKLDSGGTYAIGATTGSTISACGASNYISSFAATGGLVSGGSCATIASSNLSDASNIALLNAANTFQPTASNVGNTFKQTSGTATSGSVFDIQGANGTSHFFQISQTAANAGSVNLASLGSNDLTLDSGSGTLKLGINTSAILFTNSAAGSLNAASGQELDVGTAANAHATKLGSTSGASATTIQSGTGGVSITADGGSSSGITFKTTNSSINALLVLNSSSQNILQIDNSDSTDSSSTNYVNNPSVETAPSSSDWVLKGTASIAQDNTTAYFGSNSLKITGAATGDGAFAKLNATLSVSTSYNMVFFVKSSLAASTATVQAGYSINASAESVVCTNSLVVVYSGWYKYGCTFTTPGSGITSSNALFIKTTDATARTINVDGAVVQLSGSATAQQTYDEGNISLQGSITSPLILQNTTNSVTALAVQNSASSTIFSVDTTDTNLIGNPGFENNLAGGAGSGWTAYIGTTTPTISRDTSQAYLGYASLKVVVGSIGSAGAQYNLNPIVTTTTAGGGNYTVSFFALLGSGTAPTFQVTYSPDSITTVTCNPSGAIVTSGWMRLSCSGLTSTTSPNTGGFIRIAQTNSVVSTWYIDAVQLENSAAASAYGAGAISLNGVVTSPVTFKSVATTTAFQIQNSSSLGLLTVDSLDSIIQIGSATADANAILLVVDAYNGTTDPTGTNGGIYYNTAIAAGSDANRLRCYENGAWHNCTPGLGLTYTTSPGAWAAVLTKAATGTIIIAPIYINGAITVNALRVDVVTTALGATGDVGLYNSAGTLVLNGGSGSLTTATGLKTITPTQSAANRVIEPGQYYAAVTWNSTTGSIAGVTLTVAGQQHGVGTITGGGSVLPASITISSITDTASLPGVSINN